MNFAYSPYALIPLIAAVIAALLAILIWSRRPGRGVVPFVILMLALSFWSTANSLELSGITVETKVLFASIAYIGIVTVPAMALIFVLDYTGRDSWLTRRTYILLAIEPILVVVLVSTNSLHHAFWLDVTLESGAVSADYEHASLFWVHAVYSYLLLLVAAGFLVQAFVRSPQLYRGQITLLVTGLLAPWIANVLFLSGLSPFPDFIDLTPLGFLVTGLTTAYSLYRFRLMDIAPVAHHEIFNSMVDAVLVFDSKNRIVDVNQSAAKLLRLPSSQLIGKSSQEVFAGQSDLLSRYQDLESVDEEFTAQTDGVTRIYQIRLSPLKDRSGQITGRTVVLRDITQLKDTNRELQEARIKADEAARLKSEFLATMSHELRTPLNSILGYTGLLEMGVMGEIDDKVAHAVKRIDESGNYLLLLINNILDLAKVEAGRIDIVEEPTDVREMVAAWGEQVSVLADNKGLDLKLSIQPELPQKIYADKDRLSQIALNLLSNAVKFTEQGSITLEVAVNGGQNWMIRVNDTGIGIPPDAQQYIFDEFRQVRGQDQPAIGGGTGLGLAIVRKLANRMAGSVSVESELSKGSTFIVKLPLLPVDDMTTGT
ncbi:MAG: histidine kinase N-terminal 7TM domain-containing protein [Aggregatilineales bacterium]